MGFQVEALEALLDDAERALRSAARTVRGVRRAAGELAGQCPRGIAFLRAVLARLRGDAALASDYNRQALAQLGEDDWLMRYLVRWNQAAADWLGGRPGPAERGLTEVLAELRAAGQFFAGFLAMRVCYDLGEVQRAQGNLDAALATYRQALEEAGESSQTAITGPAHVGLAQVLYQRDELTAALDHATRGVTLCQQLPSPSRWPPAWLSWPGSGTRRVTRPGPGRRSDEAGQAGPSPSVTGLLNPVPAQRARLLLAQGDVHAAAHWAQQLRPRPGRRTRLPAGAGVPGAGPGAARPGPPRRGARAAGAAARGGRQPRPGGQRHRDRRAAGARAGGRRRGERRGGRPGRGAHPGLPQGYVRVFADEGPPMAALLGALVAAQRAEQAAARGVPLGCLARVLGAFGEKPAAPGAGRGAAAVVPGLVEQLTARELEVLALLAAGAPNPRIAGQLVVSLDTVKKHVSHLLGKLGAATRAEAVTRPASSA